MTTRANSTYAMIHPSEVAEVIAVTESGRQVNVFLRDDHLDILYRAMDFATKHGVHRGHAYWHVTNDMSDKTCETCHPTRTDAPAPTVAPNPEHSANCLLNMDGYACTCGMLADQELVCPSCGGTDIEYPEPFCNKCRHVFKDVAAPAIPADIARVVVAALNADQFEYGTKDEQDALREMWKALHDLTPASRAACAAAANSEATK